MQSNKHLKKIVKEKYTEIAGQSQNSCCGSESSCTPDYSQFSEDYSQLTGYNPDADLSLGCGLPTQFAKIRKGDTVIDLGSGAGNDCFVARAETGESGKVLGIDMTEAMIENARRNADKLGFQNVTFRIGDIESLPVDDNFADVVVSNCVLNLVPDKTKAFSETLRVLKPGGHFSISDVVLKGTLPDVLQEAAVLYAGCVSGALQKEDYLAIIKQTGFQNITIQKEREIILPENLLKQYLSEDELNTFQQNPVGIFSITVYAEKPD